MPTSLRLNIIRFGGPMWASVPTIGLFQNTAKLLFAFLFIAVCVLYCPCK